MGFLSKLFGHGDDLANDIDKAEKPASGNADAGVSMPILRTANRDGYNKALTLAALDTLSKEIYQLQQAAEAKKSGKSYELPPESDIPEIPRGRAGFNAEDVDEYIGSLKSKIAELRAQLR